MTAIEIENLTVIFAGQPVLNDFSLSIRRGEKVVLSGKSGTGKSTILRCVLGLIETWHGRLEVMGVPVDARHIWEARRHIAYVAQEPDMGRGTVGEILQQPFEFKANTDSRDNLRRLPELLANFNLASDIPEKDIRTLSGGEKQRVAMISAVLLARPVVLLDEATSALDVANRRVAADFFRQAQDMTILSVSHDEIWMDCCDRVVEL